MINTRVITLVSIIFFRLSTLDPKGISKTHIGTVLLTVNNMMRLFIIEHSIDVKSEVFKMGICLKRDVSTCSASTYVHSTWTRVWNILFAFILTLFSQHKYKKKNNQTLDL